MEEFLQLDNIEIAGNVFGSFDENVKIIHYIGKNKPWKKGYKGVLGKYYHSFAKRLDSASGTKGEV